MAYLRAAIVTTAAIMLVLLAFVFMNTGADYHQEQALMAYLEGDYQLARFELQKAEKEFSYAEWHHVHGYLAASQDQWQRAMGHFLAAEEALDPDAHSSLEMEILLGRALAAYHLQDDAQTIEAMSAARKLHPDNSYHSLLRGLAAYLALDVDSAIYHFQRPFSKDSGTEWMKHAIDSKLTKDWVDVHMAHCYIEQGQALEARQLLEQLRNEADAKYQALITYFIGLSYAKEAESKQLEAAIPYYRLALSYWGRVPIHHPQFKREQAATLRWISHASEQLVQAEAYKELPQLSAVLESWNQTEALASLGDDLQHALKRHLNARDWEKSQDVVEALQELSHNATLKEQWGQDLHKRMHEALKLQDPELLAGTWKVLSASNLSSPQLRDSLHKQVRKSCFVSAEEDDADLSHTRALLQLWLLLEQDIEDRQLFAEELVQVSKSLWLQAGQEEKAFALMRAAAQLLPSEQQRLINDDIESVLQSVYSVTSREDQVDKLPKILAAVRHFEIESINLKDKNSAANYLADAVSHFQAQRFAAARQRCEWILAIFPENTQAHALMATIAYYQLDYPGALEHFAKLPELNSDQKEAKAIALIIEGQAKDGLELLDSLTEGGYVLATQEKARLAFGLLAKQDFKAALAWFETILDPSSEVHAGKALALVHLGRYQEALGDFDLVEDALKRQQSLLGAKVIALAETGDLDGAYAHLQQLLGHEASELNAQVPSDLNQMLLASEGALSRDVIAGSFFFRYKQQPSTALYYLNRIEHSSPEVLALQAEVFYALDRLSEAETAFQEALDGELSQESRTRVLEALGKIRIAQGRWDQAAEAYQGLLEIHPERVDWRLALVQSQRNLKLWREVLQNLAHLNERRLLPKESANDYIEALVYTGNTSMARDLVHSWLSSLEEIPALQILDIARTFNRQGLDDIGTRLIRRLDMKEGAQWPAAERIALVALLVDRAEYAQAGEIINAEPQVFRSSLQGRLLVARYKANNGYHDEAMHWAYEALEHFPNHPDVLAFLDSYELDAARIHQRAEALRPHIDNLYPSVSLQIAYAQQLINFAIESDEEGDEAQWKRAEALSESRHLLEQISRRNLPYPEVYFRLGQVLFITGEIEESMIALQAALQRDPSHSNALKYQALAQERRGEIRQAIKLLRAATVWQPSDVDAWLQLGRMYKQTRELIDARSSLLQVVRYQPSNTTALVALGGLLVEMKNPEDARIVLERAVQIEPQHLTGLTLLLTSLTDPTLHIKDGTRHELRVLQHQVYTQIESLDPEHARRVAERLRYAPHRRLDSTE
jgi:predicted Zn-dependent protease